MGDSFGADAQQTRRERYCFTHLGNTTTESSVTVDEILEEHAAAIQDLRLEVAALRGDLMSLKALVSPADFEDQFSWTDPRIVEDGQA